MGFLLQHLLHETCERFPQKEAVFDGERHLSYMELERMSDRLAEILIEGGVRRGDRVAFFLKKSAEAVVSMFGVLKAGAVYVPIDPFAPGKRVEFILKDCAVTCLVTSYDKLVKMGGIPRTCRKLKVCIAVGKGGNIAETKNDTVKYIMWDEISSSGNSVTPDPGGVDTDLAYILYTSGSTGNPKGVMISHLNALTFINWAFHELGIRPVDRVANHAPLHFDLPVFDIYTGIKAGASIFLLPPELSVFPRTLIKFIRDKKISVWYSVPSILVHLISQGKLEKYSFPDLRLILFAGEVFPVKYLRQLMQIVPKADYYNLYGPIETNVCTYYKVNEVEEKRTIPVPIGKACENYDVFLVNENQEIITRPESVGELCVRGSGVAAGYWNDKKKTRSKFIRNMKYGRSDDFTYRTGDIVKLGQEGNYDLVGRVDHMVKSRGYRIELGEIEAALYSHTGIEQAVVVAVPDEMITNRIRAFIVPVKGYSLEEVEVKKFLSDRIPEYMVPEVIELRESLPKTSTGKMDRTLLAQL